MRRITEGWETRVEDDRMVAEGISIAANEHFAVVTHGRSTQADGATSLLEEQAATGGNAVALYDARGQVVFENPQVDYACVEVARTGEALACLVSRPDGPDEPVNAKPDVYSVLVLGRDGAVRARFDERTGRILDDEIALSPNGRWLAWAVIGERGRHRGMLVDLTTGTAREVESERIRELFAVSDEGDLLAGTRWVRQGTRDLLAQTAVTPRG